MSLILTRERRWSIVSSVGKTPDLLDWDRHVVRMMALLQRSLSPLRIGVERNLQRVVQPQQVRRTPS